jgi:hypothetical protein
MLSPLQAVWYDAFCISAVSRCFLHLGHLQIVSLSFLEGLWIVTLCKEVTSALGCEAGSII